MKCGNCSSPISVNLKFCAECGTKVEIKSTASEQDIANYKSILLEFLKDGKIDEDEAAELADLREDFGLSVSMHDDLLNPGRDYALVDL